MDGSPYMRGPKPKRESMLAGLGKGGYFEEVEDVYNAGTQVERVQC